MISPQKPSLGLKILLSFGLLTVSGAYALSQRNSAGQQPTSTQIIPTESYQAANNTLQQTLSTINTSPVPAPAGTTPAPVSQPQPMMKKPMHTGLYTDGSYTGSAIDAYYGTVQVKVIVTGNKITDVQFLQYPSDRSTSRYINGQAMPMLTQEAIQAQSANVSGVSGATATSDAFVQSLTGALALAKN